MIALDDMVGLQSNLHELLRQVNPILKCAYCGSIGEKFPTDGRKQTFDHINCLHCNGAIGEAINMYEELGMVDDDRFDQNE